MSKLLILQGIPASGKTTWSKEFLKGKKDWVRVNRDELLRMRGDYWVPQQEKFITKLEDFCVEEAIRSGFNVLIDATNINPKTIKKWESTASLFLAEIEFKKFDSSEEEAIERDNNREEKVGEEVIKRFYKNYIELK